MHSYERVCTALRREQPDRVPIFACLTGDSPNAGRQLRDFVAAKADVYLTRILYTGFQCTGIDVPTEEKPLQDGWVQVVYDLGEGQTLDEVVKRGSGDYVGYRKHLIGSIDDIDLLMRMPYVPPAENARLAAWVDKVNTSLTGCEYDAFLRIVVSDPLNYIAGFAAPEEFAFWTIEHRDKLFAYMDLLAERLLEQLEYLLDNLNANAVFNIGGGEYAIPPLMPPRGFHDFVLPYDRPIVELIHKYGGLVYYHSHGKVNSFLPAFVEMGVDGLHPLEPVGNTGDCDLAEVKNSFGKDLCLIGNMQYDDLMRLSTGEIRSVVREAMLAAKDGGGFILCPSCTPFHNPLPARIEENIVAFIEAGLEFGGY